MLCGGLSPLSCLCGDLPLFICLALDVSLVMSEVVIVAVWLLFKSILVFRFLVIFFAKGLFVLWFIVSVFVFDIFGVRLGHMYTYLYTHVVPLLLVHAWSHQYTPLQRTTARV